jgi:hypothetical protein
MSNLDLVNWTMREARQLGPEHTLYGEIEGPSPLNDILLGVLEGEREVHAILALKTAHRHDETGVRDIGPVRRDFILGWARVRPCVDRAEDCKRRQQKC